MKRHAALTSTYTNVLDTAGTLTAQSPSGAHRKPLRGVACGVLVAIGISLCFVPEAGSRELTYISFKQYSLLLLDFNRKEFNCLDQLYTHESQWNPTAINGTHIGIPQGNSKYLLHANGYEQIQWGLTYINARYGTPCNALHHWKVWNWH